MNSIIVRRLPRTLRQLLSFFSLSMIIFTASAAEELNKTDIRVVIDVSGSMKKNDPNNLRVPALKLLIGLLPEDVKAGVWNFGTQVKPLIAHGVTNKSWKKKANRSANKIYSADMFTNIEAALQKVSKDWGEANPDQDRNIIILTDGMVDIDKDVQKNQQSRDRILDQVIPELQQKGAKVYTISLSNNADMELMDALAISTDGSSEQVNSADQLQRVFMRMFEKAAPRDTVPLEGNRFRIDKLINEFTLLVFKKSQSKKSILISPSGEKLNKDSDLSDLAWVEEEGYELITITKPEAGQWRIDADMDPDNRVMIVTNLKLHTSDIPNNIFVGENYDYQVWLSANDKTITKEAFYKLSTLKLLQTSQGDIDEVWDLEQRDEQNRFNQILGDSFTAGQIELKASVNGKTFSREHKRTINVYDQFYSYETSEDVESEHQIIITPIEGVVQADSIKASAKLTSPSGEVSKVKARADQQGLVIHIPDPEPGEYSATLSLVATTPSGRSVALKSKVIKLGEVQAIVAQTEEEFEQEEPVSEAIDWKKIGLYLVLGNAIAFGFIGMSWFLLKRSRKKKQAAREAQFEQEAMS